MKAVLHTNSAYFSSGDWAAEKAQHFDMMNIMNSFNEAYDYARGKELEFYHSFFPEVQTYEAFIKKLRELFRQAKGDGERIKGLSNINLKQFVPNQSLKAQVDYQITITGDLSEQIPIELLASDNVSVKGGPIYLNLNIDSVKAIKYAVNTELGRHFDPENTNMRNLKQWFNEIAEENVVKQLSDNISISKKTTAAKDIIISDKVEGFLFAKNLSKEQRQAYLNGYYGPGLQKQFQQEIQKALNSIKDFIFNTCLQVNAGASYNGVNILKKAAEETWSEVVGNKPIDSQDFFFEGDNLYKSILGKGGEFQLALQDKYIRLVLSQTNTEIGHIIGDIIKDNRQEPRSDYQLVLELGGDIGETILGIQSKNIGNTSMQKIEIKSDLDLIAPNLGIGFTDAIVNSYFNTNILFEVGNMTEYLRNYLNVYFWKGMNLNIGDKLNPYHTNTFYWVGGSALVPASTIIKTLNKELITSPEFDIVKAAWQDLSDEDFLKEGDDGDPIFTEYWHGSFDHWTPLTQNYKIYQQLVDNTKIRTRFNIARIFADNGGMATFEFLNG